MNANSHTVRAIYGMIGVESDSLVSQIGRILRFRAAQAAASIGGEGDQGIGGRPQRKPS